ncbi:hypothetical protein [Aureibaculum marinum]|nr:hypothetical protein [Aureibaculum marinum]
MINKFLNIVLVICIGNWTFFNTVSKNEIIHSIKVFHKGISLTESVDCNLIEVQNEYQQPIEYYMDVESVVCGDNHCKVDFVRIFWDIFGQYKRFELPDKVKLEKAEGKDFTAEDYEKLNSILHDENSSLKDVYKHEIVSTVGTEGIDALSGSTILLEKSAYVKGAVWTCYSLWHWVHGDIKQIIRNITGKSQSIKSLQSYLSSNKKVKKLFGLEQLNHRKDYSEKSVQLVVSAIEQSSTLLKPSLLYLENAPNKVYINTIQKLLKQFESENRLFCLQHLLKTKQKLPLEFYYKLSDLYKDFTYQEIHVLLKILNTKYDISPQMINHLLPLLNHNDFLIARRLYWFLQKQDLLQEQESRIQTFYLEWKDKL